MFRSLVLAAALCQLAGCPILPPPPGPNCSDPAPVGTVTALAFGRPDTGASFAPLADGDVIGSVFGGQLSRMLPVRLRLDGADIGACIEPDVTAWRENGTPAGVVEWATPVMELPDGTHVTEDLYIIVDDDVTAGQSLTLRAEEDGVTTEVQIWVDGMN